MSAIDRVKSVSPLSVRRGTSLRTSQLVAKILTYAVLIVLAATWAFPFYWMFSSALKDDPQVFTIPPVLIPNPAHWNNFVDAWTHNNFTRYAFNSVFYYCLPVTILTVVSSTIVAYGFSRLRWPGRDFLFAICLATLMIPYQVTLVPLFITWKNLGLINTYYPLVLPGLFGNAFFIFMMRQFFMSIPEDLSEAARLDGASEFGILTQVLLPLLTPALAVVTLFRFLWAWNDYLGPLIYLNDEKLIPLAIGIDRLRSTITSTGAQVLAYPYLMAVSTIVVAPVLLLFFFAQRTFIEGISVTGIKG